MKRALKIWNSINVTPKVDAFLNEIPSAVRVTAKQLMAMIERHLRSLGLVGV
jgi:hypothetical protein